MAEIESRSATARGGVAGFFSRKIPVTDEPFARVRESKDFSVFLQNQKSTWLRSSLFPAILFSTSQGRNSIIFIML